MRQGSIAGCCLLVGALWAGPACASRGSSCIAGTGDPLPTLRGRATLGSAWTARSPRLPVQAASASHVAIRQASMALLGQTEHEDRAGRVHPMLAFAMSAVLPGSGQLAEGRNRAFAYLGVEALSWIAHFSWQDAGNKKEGEYEAYARRHWQFAAWDSLAAESNPECQSLPPNVQYDDSRETILRFLDAQNYQHYYEDIGKLEAYRAGWDDFDCAQPNTISPNRGHYRGMREDSNNYLNRARSALTVVFLNHIVSAVDAYRIAKKARLGLPGGAEMKFRVGGSPRHPSVGLRVTRAW